ncbi:MAG: hypothetical protein JO081_16655 [Alphaproteobacteria bacterium]|nr:hypothetical protein [Alphaproteobacteria bacterium]
MSAEISRVVLALDASVEPRTAIGLAVRLAARAATPLRVVFVEDEDLLCLVGLPIGREVVHGGGASALTTEQMELHLRAAAMRAEQDVREAVRSHAVEYSFEVVRGAAGAVFSAASERDLIIASALARPVAGYFRLASRWLAVLEQTPRPLLLTKEAWHKTGGVTVLVRDRSPGSARLLQAAAPIAKLDSEPMRVVCPPTLANAKDFTEWLDEQVSSSTVQVQLEAASEPAALDRQLVGSNSGTLAVAAAAAEGQRLKEFAESFAGNLLIVP